MASSAPYTAMMGNKGPRHNLHGDVSVSGQIRDWCPSGVKGAHSPNKTTVLLGEGEMIPEVLSSLSCVVHGALQPVLRRSMEVIHALVLHGMNDP